jgi:hypothetical protein
VPGAWTAGEGRPGADDPRRWARLLAAAYLAQLLGDDEAPEASVNRELKRLQLFDGPTTWKLVVWEDLDASLVLVEDLPEKKLKKDDPRPVPLPDGVDGSHVGLFAVQAPSGGLPATKVRHRGLRLDREVAYEIITIAFDGKAFSVQREPGSVGALEIDEDKLAAADAGDENDEPADG